ncbi:hypothetical protein LMG6000_03058 [Achromobacter insolitus]|uniref:Uncharacterized protein n=1 Tax=Achromobacter insolitus TaxID=217204 RepID=A0A6S7FAG7_9BURK|nr:hypothetical protein LMG5997_00022 [Achromobacter insolitus]CAB3932960.1 hypothetical protein LMG6000_03058 [Achromobacter insolitus]
MDRQAAINEFEDFVASQAPFGKLNIHSSEIFFGI